MSKSTLYLTPVTGLLLLGTAPLFAQTVPPATPEQVDKLIAVLDSNAGHKEKVDACRQLAVVGTKDAVPALAALLSDPKLSHMARYALEPIPDPAVDDALRGALGKQKGRLLVGVVGSIGVRRDVKAVEPLTRLLQDSDTDVARAAARALGRIGTADATKVLVQTLAKAPPATRTAVADACLACAESLLAHGKRTEAAAVYETVGKADLPKDFRIAAMQGALFARQSEDAP
jgi:HEAT repeat protein